MRALMSIFLIATTILLVGCSSVSEYKPVPKAPVDVAIEALVPMDSNIVVSVDDVKAPGLKWSDIGTKLNTKEGYAGLGLLVLAGVLTGLLIVFKKRKFGKRW